MNGGVVGKVANARSCGIVANYLVEGKIDIIIVNRS